MSIRGKAIYAEGHMFGGLSAGSTRLISRWLSGDDSKDEDQPTLGFERFAEQHLSCTTSSYRRLSTGASIGPPGSFRRGGVEWVSQRMKFESNAGPRDRSSRAVPGLGSQADLG
eukprot:5378066-Karenia_brevis.AAC.1